MFTHIVLFKLKEPTTENLKICRKDFIIYEWNDQGIKAARSRGRCNKR